MLYCVLQFTVTPNDGMEGAIASKLDEIEAAGQCLEEMSKKTGGSKRSSLDAFHSLKPLFMEMMNVAC